MILEADTPTKCSWFGKGYSWFGYGFLYLTLFFVLAIAFQMPKVAILQRVWFVVAGTMALFTLLFYSVCQKSLPRATVLG